MKSRPSTRPGIAAILLLLFAVPSIADPPRDELRHQGTWKSVAFVRGGEATPEEVVETITREVDADRVVWKRDGKPFAGTTVKLDPEADPKGIDVVPDGGPARDKAVLGIYKIEGDTLTICMADPDTPRPKRFAAGKGEKTTLMTFRKVRRTPPRPKP